MPRPGASTASRGARPPVGLFGLQTKTTRVRSCARSRQSLEIEDPVRAHGHLDGGRPDAGNVLPVGHERRRREHGLFARPEHGRREVADQRVGAVRDRDALGLDIVTRADALEQRAAALRIAVGPRDRGLRRLEGARQRAELALVRVQLGDPRDPEPPRELRGGEIGLVRREERVAEALERDGRHARRS